MSKIGNRYGRLVVIDRICRDSHGTIYLCKCDCGNYVERYSYALRDGMMSSCGCLMREKSEHNAQLKRERAERVAERKRLRAEAEAEKQEKKRLKEERQKAIEAEREEKRRLREEKRQQKEAEKKELAIKQSLCWTCIHSAAPPSLQCIRDRNKGVGMPEGARVEDTNENIIISCPQYDSMLDINNKQKLIDARMKYREEQNKLRHKEW